MLTDEVTIKVEAGKGGDGSASFRREKYVPKGGPDGGDGGKGGDIIFKVDGNQNTLTYFNTRKSFKADDGDNGGKQKSSGKNADDLILTVPPGTIVYQIFGSAQRKILDLTEIGKDIKVAKGGIGGRGNVHFATATHQTPHEFETGKLGEKKTLKLELQMIADVGLIGLPNAGKSTLLARISKAKPKIANYAFTTLEPNLGVVDGGDFSFVAADIPGLIQGASQGKGLGHKFLRHIKRTKVLIHLIDANSLNHLKDYKDIRNELKQFSPELVNKQEIVVVSKVDSITEKDQRRIYAKVVKLKPIFLSSQTGRGIKDLLYVIKKYLANN
ncbi:MAG: hypothetical protein ACD_58C00031G0006 [uncultured bacterium]|nr:MAG: hypothetical protein ACD_58C00031G0006 [uncultured bacterium]